MPDRAAGEKPPRSPPFAASDSAAPLRRMEGICSSPACGLNLPMPWRYLERVTLKPSHQFRRDIRWRDPAFLPEVIHIAWQCTPECRIGGHQPALQPDLRVQSVCTASRIDPGAHLSQQMAKQDVILKYNRSSVHISLLRIATNQASTSSANSQCKRIEAACAGSFVSCQLGVVAVGVIKLKVRQAQCRIKRGIASGCSAARQ